jgi:hypothetical protein
MPFMHLIDFVESLKVTPDRTALFPDKSFTILAGKPKVGKTSIAFALAHAFATGIPFGAVETDYRVVYYLSYEENESELAMLAQPYLESLNGHNLIINPTPISLDVAAGLQQLGWQIHDATTEGYKCLVIIDCLHACLGSKRIQDSVSVREFLHPIRQFARDCAPVIMLHHLNKYGSDVADNVQIQGTATQIIQMSYEQHPNHRIIHWDCCGRASHGIHKLKFLSRNSHHFIDAHTHSSNKPLHKSDKCSDPILRILADGPQTVQELARRAQLSKRTTYKVINRLLKKKLIKALTTSHTPHSHTTHSHTPDSFSAHHTINGAIESSHTYAYPQKYMLTNP